MLVVKTFDVEKFNPNHVPAGSPEGGQFASAGDSARLTTDAISSRHDAFAAKYGATVAHETDQLAADWFTMRPTSHIDAFLKGTLPDGPEKAAWDAIHADTQARLAATPGDQLDLYRGIPGKVVADAVAQAKANGAKYIEIPLHDSLNQTHQAICTTAQQDLATDYASRRWTRHGGDPAEAHMGIVMHLRVPKSDIVFATAHSAFTNPNTPNWNEYLVSTKGAPSLKIPISDVSVVQ